MAGSGAAAYLVVNVNLKFPKNGRQHLHKQGCILCILCYMHNVTFYVHIFIVVENKEANCFFVLVGYVRTHILCFSLSL